MTAADPKSDAPIPRPLTGQKPWGKFRDRQPNEGRALTWFPWRDH
jgi:hypothetical protein